nr:hypothetical protein Iba_chr12cCG12950 [Ipomoea batatas]
MPPSCLANRRRRSLLLAEHVLSSLFHHANFPSKPPCRRLSPPQSPSKPPRRRPSPQQSPSKPPRSLASQIRNLRPRRRRKPTSVPSIQTCSILNLSHPSLLICTFLSLVFAAAEGNLIDLKCQRGCQCGCQWGYYEPLGCGILLIGTCIAGVLVGFKAWH